MERWEWGTTRRAETRISRLQPVRVSMLPPVGCSGPFGYTMTCRQWRMLVVVGFLVTVMGPQSTGAGPGLPRRDRSRLRGNFRMVEPAPQALAEGAPRAVCHASSSSSSATPSEEAWRVGVGGSYPLGAPLDLVLWAFYHAGEPEGVSSAPRSRPPRPEVGGCGRRPPRRAWTQLGAPPAVRYTPPAATLLRPDVTVRGVAKNVETCQHPVAER